MRRSIFLSIFIGLASCIFADPSLNFNMLREELLQENNRENYRKNPFAIDFPEKENLTPDDYIEIQRQLRKIDIAPLIHSLFPQDKGYLAEGGFLGRSAKGLKQVLIDPKKQLYPVKKLVKIGRGGGNCIVSCAPYNNVYPSSIKDIPGALRASGFNGYLLYLVGGISQSNR